MSLLSRLRWTGGFLTAGIAAVVVTMSALAYALADL